MLPTVFVRRKCGGERKLTHTPDDYVLPLKYIDMKKYAVLRKIGSFNASVEREFDDFETAVAFAAILTASEEHNHTTYHVAEILK